jgi:hypothetical protein|tara:strand:+ start:3050 stop:3571 length:522 start_codon:yes stop_codon:yes gene_type:complete
LTYGPIGGVKIVGFTGLARAGKDEAAKVLAGMRPGSRIYAFSDAISVIARAHHGMQRRAPGVLQRVGLAERQRNPSVWLDALYWKIDEDRPSTAIVTGVRFKDEAEMILGMGGKVVKVVRTDEAGSLFVSVDRDSSHETEMSMRWIKPDMTVYNRSGHMSDFQGAVCALSPLL